MQNVKMRRKIFIGTYKIAVINMKFHIHEPKIFKFTL